MADAHGRLDQAKILIVDDDPDVLESVEAAVEAEGALTMTSMDGNEAVELCLVHQPDLVILDMMLPSRSGFLVLERIKGREESPMVIMMTANSGRRHQAYAESLGVDAYLLKPFGMERLLDKAAELLRQRASELGQSDLDPSGSGPSNSGSPGSGAAPTGASGWSAEGSGQGDRPA
jgi:DNA-binding response OmpR family regulator